MFVGRIKQGKNATKSGKETEKKLQTTKPKNNKSA